MRTATKRDVAAVSGRKLIFVNRYFHPDHSATAQMLSDLAFGVAGKGSTVCVITARQRIDDAHAALPAREDVRGVRVHRVWTTRFGRGAGAGRLLDYATFCLAALARLAATCRRDDVVVALSDPPMLSVIVAWVVRLRGAVQVNWLHDLFPEVAQRLHVRATGGRAAGSLRQWRNWSLRGASVNVALGERMAAYLVAEGVPAQRVRVIHNWADGAAIRPLARAANKLRRGWGLADKFVVAYSGNMGRVHVFDAVLDAAARLRDQPRVVFLFIGGGRERARLERAVAARGLANVQFRPYQLRARLAESLGLADIHLISLHPELEDLVVPSKFYGIAAAARPTLFLGAADGEIARMLRRHNCGWSVEPSDGEQLASRIRALSQDLAACDAAGQRARAAFDRFYCIERALSAWCDVLGTPAAAEHWDPPRAPRRATL